MRSPDYAGPLIGWRVWLVVETSRGPRLSSVIHEEVWPVQDELLARCRRREDPFAAPVEAHAAPAPGCCCGVHAARDAETVLPYLRGRNEPWTIARVLGEVALWGEVVEHDGGWRAERAYPASILVPITAAGLVDELHVYGVPVRCAAWPAATAAPTAA